MGELKDGTGADVTFRKPGDAAVQYRYVQDDLYLVTKDGDRIAGDGLSLSQVSASSPIGKFFSGKLTLDFSREMLLNGAAITALTGFELGGIPSVQTGSTATGTLTPLRCPAWAASPPPGS